MKFEECKIDDLVKANSNEIRMITSMGLPKPLHPNANISK